MHIYNLSEGLTTRELAISRQLFNQYKNEADKFIEDYGAEAENVARGRSIKLAKNMATKESKQRIKEMIKKALSTKPQSVEEVIDSTKYLKNRKIVKK